MSPHPSIPSPSAPVETARHSPSPGEGGKTSHGNPASTRTGPHGNEIRQANSAAELDDARALMRSFVAWHRGQHPEHIDLIDRYFNKDKFEAELTGLPGKYAPPKGNLLIAYCGDAPAGCVASRPLGDRICEMKRMFVLPEYRGLGIGYNLAARLIQGAKKSGYELMRLDTSFRQLEAIRLYEKLGFRRSAPYYQVEKDMRDFLVFFERPLQG